MQEIFLTFLNVFPLCQQHHYLPFPLGALSTILNQQPKRILYLKLRICKKNKNASTQEEKGKEKRGGDTTSCSSFSFKFRRSSYWIPRRLKNIN